MQPVAAASELLQHIPASSFPHEWETVGPALAPAIALDPMRDTWTVLDQAVRGGLDFWRLTGATRGWVVTQKDKRTLWVIYAAGQGGSLNDKRDLMALIEAKARDLKCNELRFEGRDWRKVFPDFSAHQTPDKRWHFRKAL